MEQLNDFYKIIQNNYDSTKSINKDSIYDEILKREKDLKETMNRVIDFKNTQDKERTLFINTKFYAIFINMFSVLNGLVEDITKMKKITYKRLRKVIGKEHRIIYFGLFMIIIAIFLAMIEVSDSI